MAKLAGIGIETIRFYEREGIIEDPPRRESGYREYSTEIIGRLHFIKRAQELGFSLKEISELLALRVNPEEEIRVSGSKEAGRIKARGDRAHKIRDLKRMQKILNEVTEACVASKPISDCPILKSFEV